MDLQIEKENVSPVEYRLKVSVPAETMAERVSEAMAKLTREARLPGFRPGKIPRRVIENRFGKSVEVETMHEVLQEAYREALSQVELDALSPGEMQDVQYEAGNPLTFTVQVEVMPEIALPELSEVTVELAEPYAEDADVEQALESLRESQAVLSPVEGPVAEDSVVTADFQELDPSGLPIVGRVQRDVQIDLAKNRFGDEFKARLLHLQEGQSAVVELPVRGGEKEPKTTRFQVTVNVIQRKELPVLDDEFARSVNPNMTTLEAMKADLKKYLEARAMHSAREQMFRRIADDLLRKTDFPVPPRMLDDYLDRMFRNGRRDQKTDPDPKELEHFKDENRSSATWNLRWYLLRKMIVAGNDIEVTDDEFEQEVQRLAILDEQQPAAFKKKLTEHQADHVREDLLERKLLSFLHSQVRVVPRAVSLAEFEGRSTGRIITS